MPNLKEVRIRITSVNSTKQITSAMKMVSAAKLKRAQNVMKHTSFCLALIISFLYTISGQSQPKFTEKKIGHIYYLRIPDYLAPATGILEKASCQYENKVKKTYLAVRDSAKNALLQSGLNLANLEKYNDFVLQQFSKENEKGYDDYKIKSPHTLKNKTGNNVILTEVDRTFEEEPNDDKVTFLIGAVETKDYFYTIYCGTLSESFDKLKDDFNEIILSLHD